MPSAPAALPGDTDPELRRAHEQLAQTSALLVSIAEGVTAEPTPESVAGIYLRRLGLSALLDLAFSFSSEPAVPQFASKTFHDLLHATIQVVVCDPILLWFAPGSTSSSGSPCFVRRLPPSARSAVPIREVYMDPTALPGLWWTGESRGPNELLAAREIEAVLRESLDSGVTSNAPTHGMEPALTAMMGMEPPPRTDQGGERRSAGAEADGNTSILAPSSTPHTGSSSAEVEQAGPSIDLEGRGHRIQDVPRENPEGQGAASPAATFGTATSRQAETAGAAGTAATEVTETAIPITLLGAGSVGSRWSLLGKLEGTEERVGLDLDHPKTIGIYGFMGSGKSYLLGDLIESAVMPIPNINRLRAPLAVVVFNYRRNATDRFELGSLSRPNSDPGDLARLAAEYQAAPVALADVHVLCLPGELRPARLDEYHGLTSSELMFDARALGAEDWELLMGEPGSDSVFARTIRDTLVGLRLAGEITLAGLQSATMARLTGSSRAAAGLRFDFVRRYVSQEGGADFASLVRPGRVLVIDLRQPLFNKDDALRFFLVCASQISRIQGAFNKVLVFDEAHEYMSNMFEERMEARIRLMRHEGTSYVFATQDVGSIPAGIARFLSTRFVFDLGSGENLRELIDNVPEFRGTNCLGMAAGHCFVQSSSSSGRSFARPRLIRVRPRVTQHGGATRIFSGPQP